MIGIVLHGEHTAGGLEEIVVHHLVDAPVGPGEPVVDRGEVAQHLSLDAGLLGDLTHGCLLRGLFTLEMALGQAPFDTPGAVAAGDHRGESTAVLDVHHQAAG